MASITEFLEARIAEDEAALDAVPVTPGDPLSHGRQRTNGQRRTGRTQEARARVAEDALRVLAAVYKDHPDDQQEWATDAPN